jgi:hypothetical protein
VNAAGPESSELAAFLLSAQDAKGGTFNMRRLLAILLMLGMATVASAVDWNIANHPQPIDKDSYVGDNMGDTREGGETFGSAVAIGSLPYSDTGATCDNADDITLPCAASAAPEVVYSYVAAAGVSAINVSLCGSGYDCALGIYDMNQINIACNDDFCGLQSQIDHIAVTTGQTYYIVVDGFSTNCGSYVINVTADVPPPPLDCPEGSWLEGEPDCYDGYYDDYNGGCNSNMVFQPICPIDGDHAVMCGKSGTYLYQGFSYRDTDWFKIIPCGGQVCATWLASFPIQAILIYGTNCNALQYDLATAPANVPVTLCRNLTAEAWLWAGASQFNGIPCGSDYTIDVTGICDIPGECGEVPGACCVGTDCFMLTETDCIAQGGRVVGGSCTPQTCVPIPTESKSWGAIKNLYK